MDNSNLTLTQHHFLNNPSHSSLKAQKHISMLRKAYGTSNAYDDLNH